MSEPTAAGSVRAFDLGPRFVIDGSFVLAEADWAATLRLGDVLEEAATWSREIFGDHVVALASGVVHVADRMETFVPALDDALRHLGPRPADPALAAQTQAIIGVLAAAMSEQVQACDAAAAVVEDFVARVRAAGAAPEAGIPGDLARAVALLRTGWVELDEQLLSLQAFVTDQVQAEQGKGGKSFRIKLETAQTVERWGEARAAANRWRVEAYVR